MIKIAVSACLLGVAVRYDGGHKHHPPLLTTADREDVCLLPFCPEADCGLGTPREPMRLQQLKTVPRLLTVTTRIDHTEQLKHYCRAWLEAQRKTGLDGFIFKSKSPSCGLDVPLFHSDGHPVARGKGVFVTLVRQLYPGLPMVEGDLLADATMVEQFFSGIAG